VTTSNENYKMLKTKLSYILFLQQKILEIILTKIYMKINFDVHSSTLKIRKKMMKRVVYLYIMMS